MEDESGAAPAEEVKGTTTPDVERATPMEESKQAASDNEEEVKAEEEFKIDIDDKLFRDTQFGNFK